MGRINVILNNFGGKLASLMARWLFYVGNQGSLKNSNSHIDASHSRQPLVKGERLVRYEVNAVMAMLCKSQERYVGNGVRYCLLCMLGLGVGRSSAERLCLFFFAPFSWYVLVVARKQTTSREILLWMTPSEAPKALQASECSELLDPTGASCWIFAQR